MTDIQRESEISADNKQRRALMGDRLRQIRLSMA